MIENKTIYQVDAFTDEPFKGNPAGVMFVDEKVSTYWMQHVAMEMNLSETAFILRKENVFHIRYFTPTTEVALCGHATLASAHIIYETGMKSANEIIKFITKDNEIIVRKENNWIVMSFPKFSIMKIDIHNNFRQVIGFKPIEMYSSNYDWIIAVAGNENDISHAMPDFEQMKKTGLGNLMITSRSNTIHADFVVRCFAPIDGINEDPVTGSAHCALAPLWADKLGKTELDSLQLSKRTGKLKVKSNNNSVEIKGKAVTIFEAQLKICPCKFCQL